MELLEQFINHVTANGYFHKESPLVVAVSGGLDSVVLTDLCSRAGYRFGIAHCNFQLRGGDSARDETFVKELAERYRVPFHVVRFDTLSHAKSRRIGIQEAARELRYEWFARVRSEHGYAHLLTAHHADDNIETVAMNFFRGTGIRGLHGIEPVNDYLVRPLLFADRAMLEKYFRSEGLRFVADSSNDKDDYTRNHFRLNVIPRIEEAFPAFRQNMRDNIERFRQVERLYDQAVALHKKKLMEFRGDEVHIPVRKLLKVDPLRTILFEIIRDYGFTAGQLDDVMSLVHSSSGRWVASAGHRAIRNREWLIIAPIQASGDSMTVITGPGDWSCAMGILRIKGLEIAAVIPQVKSDDRAVVLIDAGDIRYPMLLRRWKQGDYFYPLGMRKKKKIARFLIDRKLSLAEKERVWVLESDRRIVWVIGERIDDRFRVVRNSSSLLQLSWLSAGTE